MSKTNYYDVLEVNPGARKAVIDAAWKALSKEYGDTNPDRRILNEAHDVLSDEAKRQEHDRSLRPAKVKGTRIGGYRILDQIAEGSLGVTYRAVHEESGKLACIKHSIKISPLDTEIMREEARTIWDLRHWAIPAVKDLITLDDGSIAIAMSYIPGPTMQQIVEKEGAIEPWRLCWITDRVLNGLRYLHDNSVIHGDVKPANIIVQDETHQACLVDYGFSLTKPGKGSTNKGFTPKYSSPEQREKRTLLPESDLYSLGMTMIYALGGDPGKATVPEDTPEPLFAN
jgi:serine/threonine protein kinase